MSDLNGQEGELKFRLKITRAATGNVEMYDVVGKISDNLGEQHGSNTLDSSAQCGNGCGNSPDRGIG
ncbi:MAG: hypothetical protein K2Q13_04100 [Nitrosomonas sp.]|uniref:hypothetical protein n=1 Tax=Nitrosomonas sp. TaxID=42353 RepID=UPI0025F2B3E5|nr:hypothetical protein [Nitrosomonas sp.]MBY0474230.1 hypothetical protein [Nitrosomonas sp.]